MTRYCPNCGAIVPPNSLTCPQCYCEIPRDMREEPEPGYNPRYSTRSKEEYREQIGRRHKSTTVALILATIPALFGLLGLGLIYEDHRDWRGYRYLLVGLALYIIMAAMIILVDVSGTLGLILFIIPLAILAIIYIGCAAASVAETWLGNLNIFGFRY